MSVCAWPYEVCDDAVIEARGLCHRHRMQAQRSGILRQFPRSAFFRGSDDAPAPSRPRPTVCSCAGPRRGEGGACDWCGRLIADVDRVAYLRARYRFDRTARRWVRAS